MLATALVAGCATRIPAPIIERAPLASLPPPAAAVTPAPAPVAPVPTYMVRRGDTLRSIAQEKGVDVRELAAWNNLVNPNRLDVGQVLRLGPPAPLASEMPIPGPTDVSGPGVTTSPLLTPPPVVAAGSGTGAAPGAGAQPLPGPRTAENYKSSPKAIKEPYSPEALRDFGKIAAATPAPPETTAAPPPVARAEPPAPPASTAPPVSDDDHLGWIWPAKGTIVGAFSETANLKGIDIAGDAGTPVVASAAGKVVYAGSGLRGYGKLVIIKHNDTYLSAYAHNRAIVVKEGDTVARGQKIAEMGKTDADRVKLHFEIRRLGKPMDPVRFLPPAS